MIWKNELKKCFKGCFSSKCGVSQRIHACLCGLLTLFVFPEGLFSQFKVLTKFLFDAGRLEERESLRVDSFAHFRVNTFRFVSADDHELVFQNKRSSLLSTVDISDHCY